MKKKAMSASTDAKANVPCRPLDEWVAYRFGLIATRMGVIGQRAYQGKYKLSTSAWRAMAVVARYEPCSAAELSSHSRLDPPKVSRAIEVLTERNLLERNKDPQDQRRAVLTLTPQGRAMYDDIASQVEGTESFITATLSEREVKALWAAVEKIDAQIALYMHPAEESASGDPAQSAEAEE
jgi:DNA-binding MarR family transcriptional regulator